MTGKAFFFLILFKVRENYPHLVLPGTAMARKMGFPDVIMPGEFSFFVVRNIHFKDDFHNQFLPFFVSIIREMNIFFLNFNVKMSKL